MDICIGHDLKGGCKHKVTFTQTFTKRPGAEAREGTTALPSWHITAWQHILLPWNTLLMHLINLHTALVLIVMVLHVQAYQRVRCALADAAPLPDKLLKAVAAITGGSLAGELLPS
jgi:hypothetical protein